MYMPKIKHQNSGTKISCWSISGLKRQHRGALNLRRAKTINQHQSTIPRDVLQWFQYVNMFFTWPWSFSPRCFFAIFYTTYFSRKKQTSIFHFNMVFTPHWIVRGASSLALPLPWHAANVAPVTSTAHGVPHAFAPPARRVVGGL